MDPVPDLVCSSRRRSDFWYAALDLQRNLVMVGRFEHLKVRYLMGCEFYFKGSDLVLFAIRGLIAHR